MRMNLSLICIYIFAKLGNYQLFRAICIENISQYLICVYLVTNYFSKEKKGIHIYTGFQILRKMYVMLILHMVEMYATHDFSAKE